MDKILLLGCSHTYGDGLDDVSLQDPWNGHSRKSWLYHMYHNERIINKSYTGCSNDMIALKLHRYAEPDNKVIIMFTYPERYHITRKGLNFIAYPDSSMAISDNPEENRIAEQINKRVMHDNKKIMLDHFDDNFLELMFLKNILLCQYFCENKNLEYYFTMVDNRPKTNCTGSLEKYRDSLYDNINWQRIFLVDDKYGFSNYAEHIGAEAGSDKQHWGEEYHKTFGKLFFDWINKQKVL